MMKKLSKEEMKKVVGGLNEGGDGSGARCVYFCCPNDGTGPCSTGVSVPTECASNEDCQSRGGFTCTQGNYLAALCKG